jgi:MFS family permease
VTSPEPTPPPLTEAARSVYEAARTLAGACGGSFTALRRLVAADMALARQAMIQGLVLLLIAGIMAGTTWVLLIALLVWVMLKAGVGWGWAIALPLLVSVALGVFAFLQAAKALRLADMDASRRQLTLWFGTPDEAEEARQAPQGSLNAGAAPQGATASESKETKA